MKPTIEQAIRSASFEPSDRLTARAAALRSSRRPARVALRWVFAVVAFGAVAFAGWQNYPRVKSPGEWISIPTAKIHCAQPFTVAIPARLIGGYAAGVESTVDAGSSGIKIDRKYWSSDRSDLIVEGHFRGYYRDATELRTTLVQLDENGKAPKTIAWLVINIRAPFTCVDSQGFSVESADIPIKLDPEFVGTRLRITQQSTNITAEIINGAEPTLKVRKPLNDYGFVVLRDEATGYERAIRLQPKMRSGESIHEYFGYNLNTPTNGQSKLAFQDVNIPSVRASDWKFAIEPNLGSIKADAVTKNRIDCTFYRAKLLGQLQPIWIRAYCNGVEAWQTILVHEAPPIMTDAPTNDPQSGSGSAPPRLPH